MLLVCAEVYAVILLENLVTISKDLKVGICLDIAMTLLGIYSKEMIMSMHTNYAQIFLHLHSL